jgi:o-succinylbenzoate synthase
MKAEYKAYNLEFKFPAGTSRGILTSKKTWFLKISDSANQVTGIGEAGPLPGLSIDDRPEFESRLEDICRRLEVYQPEDLYDSDFAELLGLQEFPSIVFALETAFNDYRNNGVRKVFSTEFTEGRKAIPINGLIWMGDESFMKDQISRKLAEGYKCLKMKIGAIGFEKECRILESLRNEFSEAELTLRVDANGAFSPEEAPGKLKKLAEYKIHSIEQPVKQGQIPVMKKLCAEAPISVALDEELIGVYGFERKQSLLKEIQPQYIILKPTLVGGFSSSTEWIRIAESLGIGWWITSALESNIGLNAIAQYTSMVCENDFPQGLGTGQLYTNNIESPLVIQTGKLHYSQQLEWKLAEIF